ncbi:hypothetical protein FJU30_08345 [Affinibrenneria salicis]|uniref:Uncharacterized protein n=1 Tax=Affinibrenneria salicis TaxID=2590031 RepID=A0A5J5G304_9GAMM|nr:hypothetical protein [Affinibrenneria salicis]KAA9001238.1 hypothetical protein FJU30_08345 [Affinibrenneria salicis]
MFSANAWLQQKIDQYKHNIRDATVDFYMAEARLNNSDSHIDHLRRYNNACMEMAELCLQNGDDESYLHALVKLHNRLIKEINREERCHLFRVQSYYFARHTLKLICHQLSLQGSWEKATAFQTDFVKRVPFLP